MERIDLTKRVMGEHDPMGEIKKQPK